MLAALKFLYRHTLNSVPFGIALMALVAAYIAFGSGFAPLREYFEMDEILFFNWWPLKVLMVLLVLNLSVVTVARIPLTPPRFGVWTIHLGIILLILSTSAYYYRKVEGLTLVPVGGSTGVFFDRWERALYIQLDEPTNFRPVQTTPLPSLPRFHEYTVEKGNASYLDRRELKNLMPMVRELDRTTGTPGFKWTPLDEALALPGKLSIDLVEYYPYADMKDVWKVGGDDGRVGVRIARVDGVDDPNVSVPAGLAYWDDVGGQTMVGATQIEHRHVKAQADVDDVIASAKRVHKLKVDVAGKSVDLLIEPGQTVAVGDTGYSLTLESFVRNWRMINQEVRPAIILMVKRTNAPAGEIAEYRRMVKTDLDEQTDFKLGVEGAGPMGKRQDKPLDNNLVVHYTFSDPVDVCPQGDGPKQLLITSDDSPRLTWLKVDSTHAPKVDVWEDGRGGFFADTEVMPPMMAMMGGGHSADDGHEHGIPLAVQRESKLSWTQDVSVVERAKRNSNEGQAGLRQVVKLRIKSGDWSTDVLVPFAQFTNVAHPQSRSVEVPGASAKMRFTLGTTMRPMPVTVRLDKFTATPYAGQAITRDASNEAASTPSPMAGGVMRDFKSELSVTDANGNREQKSASLNDPAFITKASPVLPALFSESWILYQAQWDAQRQRFTVLGVANRPAVHVMAFSCILIAVGLMYAFYAKPVIIKRMKQRAIEQAKAKKASREVVATNG
ncbi:MAG: hypothetical protein QM770_08040 [Tepidisphaeraceae bacterium]